MRVNDLASSAAPLGRRAKSGEDASTEIPFGLPSGGGRMGEHEGLLVLWGLHHLGRQQPERLYGLFERALADAHDENRDGTGQFTAAIHSGIPSMPDAVRTLQVTAAGEIFLMQPALADSPARVCGRVGHVRDLFRPADVGTTLFPALARAVDPPPPGSGDAATPAIRLVTLGAELDPSPPGAAALLSGLVAARQSLEDLNAPVSGARLHPLDLDARVQVPLARTSPSTREAVSAVAESAAASALATMQQALAIYVSERDNTFEALRVLRERTGDQPSLRRRAKAVSGALAHLEERMHRHARLAGAHAALAAYPTLTGLRDADGTLVDRATVLQQLAQVRREIEAGSRNLVDGLDGLERGIRAHQTRFANRRHEPQARQVALVLGNMDARHVLAGQFLATATDPAPAGPAALAAMAAARQRYGVDARAYLATDYLRALVEAGRSGSLRDPSGTKIVHSVLETGVNATLEGMKQDLKSFDDAVRAFEEARASGWAATAGRSVPPEADLPLPLDEDGASPPLPALVPAAAASPRVDPQRVEALAARGAVATRRVLAPRLAQFVSTGNTLFTALAQLTAVAGPQRALGARAMKVADLIAELGTLAARVAQRAGDCAVLQGLAELDSLRDAEGQLHDRDAVAARFTAAEAELDAAFRQAQEESDALRTGLGRQQHQHAAKVRAGHLAEAAQVLASMDERITAARAEERRPGLSSHAIHAAIDQMLAARARYALDCAAYADHEFGVTLIKAGALLVATSPTEVPLDRDALLAQSQAAFAVLQHDVLAFEDGARAAFPGQRTADESARQHL